MSRKAVPSLRRHLIVRLSIPLLVLMLIDAGLSYHFALGIARSAFDHWLLDSARSLAAQATTVSGRPALQLPKEALDVFEFDLRDRVLYQVAMESGEVILGEWALRIEKPASASANPAFFESTFNGEPIRGVAVYARPQGADQSLTVAVAETMRKRRDLAAEILLIALVPQLILIACAGMLIWSGVTGGLHSLGRIADALEAKGPRDMSAVPSADVPAEVKPIIGKVNELLSRLTHAMAGQRKFIADAAHQLRTPLAALKLQAENLAHLPASPELRESVDALRRTSARATHLAQQLLTLARAESGVVTVGTVVDADLVEIARECADRHVEAALAAGIELVLDAPARPVMLRGDPTLLGELVLNLLDNAIRYGKGTDTVTVRIEPGPPIAVSVEDHGPGVSREEMPLLLQRFYRGASNAGEGTGLGLAIVREIAEGHGGVIELRSRPEFAGFSVRAVFARSLQPPAEPATSSA